MKLILTKREEYNLKVLSLLVGVLMLTFLLNHFIVFQGFPGDIVANATYDVCVKNHIIDCGYWDGKRLWGLISRPMQCCAVENRSYFIKDIRYLWETDPGIIRSLRDFEKAEECNDVRHLLC